MPVTARNGFPCSKKNWGSTSKSFFFLSQHSQYIISHTHTHFFIHYLRRWVGLRLCAMLGHCVGGSPENLFLKQDQTRSSKIKLRDGRNSWIPPVPGKQLELRAEGMGWEWCGDAGDCIYSQQSELGGEREQCEEGTGTMYILYIYIFIYIYIWLYMYNIYRHIQTVTIVLAIRVPCTGCSSYFGSFMKSVRTIIHIIHSMWKNHGKNASIQHSQAETKHGIIEHFMPCIGWFRWPLLNLLLQGLTLHMHIIQAYHVRTCPCMFFYYSSLFWLFSFMQIHLRTRCDSMACMACLVQNSRHRNSFLLRQERPSMQRCSMLLQVCRAFSKPQGPLPKMAR